VNDRGAGRPESAPAIDGDALLNLLVDVARLGPDAIFLIDPATGTVLWVNTRISDLAGWDPSDVIGQPIQSFDTTIPGDPLVWSQITSEMPVGQLMTFTGRFRCRDGSERPVDVRLTLARHGDTTTLIAVAREVEGRVRVEERLREREATLATVIGALHDGVLVVDREGMVTLANPRAAELTGIPLDQIVHEPVTRVLQSRTDEQGRPIPVERSPLLETLATGRHLTDLVHGVRGPEPRWLLVNTAPIVDEVTGEIRGAVATNADITELIRAQEQLEELAGLDSLTGLPNRSRFQSRLAEAVDKAQGSDLIGLLFLDLDGFKTVNDTLGHSQGDELLRLAGSRLRSQLRPEDFVARIGGDEFVVVLPALPHELAHADATEVAQRIVDNLSGPFELSSQTVRISASIGIAFASAESADAEQLLRQADLAMYAAKEGGRGAFRIYEPEMDEAARHALELDGELRRALAHGELAVKLQPRIDVATGALSGAEVLLRWPGSGTGPFDTAAIVAAGERNGLIQPIGRFVLGEACRVASHLLDAGLLGEGCTVSVNVSGFQLQRPEFVPELAELLAKYHLPYGAITVELTESALVHGFVHASTRLHELSEIGVPVAIDDFGTGYSSLAYLRDLPVRELKLDQSFVADLGTDRVAETIVEGIIGIAQRLGIDTVAEGVERPEQLAFLATAGCTHYQGYLASAALTIEDFLARYAPGVVLH
jgi:diguanylate cyclase (GGDEF)-like protein/PAS domain S-box-containing protein